MTDELEALLADADRIDQSNGEPAPTPDTPSTVAGPAPKYQPDPEIIGALKMVLIMCGNGLASHFGSDHWNLDDNQATAIAVPLDAVLSKYLGSGYNLPPEITLLMAVGAVFVPKYQQQRAIDGEKSEPGESEPAHAVSGG